MLQVEANIQSGEWGAAANPHDRLVAELSAAARSGLRATVALHQEHTQYVDQFMERKDDALHLDLRFLAVHANLNSYFQVVSRRRAPATPLILLPIGAEVSRTQAP